MAPRAYRLGQRQAGTEQTRARIIAAARELFRSGASFSIDAVDREAGVARMTVYYQFGSKAKLLDALFDELATQGLLERLPAVFAQREPLDALRALIGAFVNFWHSDTAVIRRIHGVAALDAEVDQANAAREERRRGLLRKALAPIAEKYGRPPPEMVDEAVDILFTLTSFETYDRLAEPARGPEEVEGILNRLARAVIGLPAEEPDVRGTRRNHESREPARSARR